MRKVILLGTALPLLMAPAVALAQPEPIETGPTPPTSGPITPEQAVEELRALRAERQQMQREMQNFDSRIEALESQLGVTPPAPSAQLPQSELTTAQPGQTVEPGQVQTAGQDGQQTTPAVQEAQDTTGWGSRYEPGRGFILFRGEVGELGAGVYSYARYLNQTALDTTYTDSFGRVLPLADIRNDIQLQKLSWNFKGWLFDPNFRYYFFFWTSNSQMGEGAQVVLGGYFQYRFSDLLTITAGVMPLPTTRSTNYTFPNWLRNDNRVMADEFFRGSYSTGIDAQGELLHGLRYRVAIANNLAQLGVSSQELDASFNTFSGALWWMPTTGEFGPASGFGDYENHQRVATLLGIHYTRSRETAQGQPAIDDFENSQIRLSDGTLLFSPDPFGTGGKVERATYQMMALNAGVKYRGFALEGEYYFRWVDDFDVIGTIPVTDLYDNGFSLQASAMVMQNTIQAYATYSHIFGQYGNPSELSLGINLFPFRRREVRWNFQALRLDHSPVGGSSLPMVVGGNGWVFSTDWIVAF